MVSHYRPKEGKTQFSKMFHEVSQLALKFNLLDPGSKKNHLQWADYSSVRKTLHRVDQYKEVGMMQLTLADG